MNQKILNLIESNDNVFELMIKKYTRQIFYILNFIFHNNVIHVFLKLPSDFYVIKIHGKLQYIYLKNCIIHLSIYSLSSYNAKFYFYNNDNKLLNLDIEMENYFDINLFNRKINLTDNISNIINYLFQYASFNINIDNIEKLSIINKFSNIYQYYNNIPHYNIDINHRLDEIYDECNKHMYNNKMMLYFQSIYTYRSTDDREYEIIEANKIIANDLKLSKNKILVINNKKYIIYKFILYFTLPSRYSSFKRFNFLKGIIQLFDQSSNKIHNIDLNKIVVKLLNISYDNYHTNYNTNVYNYYLDIIAYYQKIKSVELSTNQVKIIREHPDEDNNISRIEYIDFISYNFIQNKPNSFSLSDIIKISDKYDINKFKQLYEFHIDKFLIDHYYTNIQLSKDYVDIFFEVAPYNSNLFKCTLDDSMYTYDHSSEIIEYTDNGIRIDDKISPNNTIYLPNNKSSYIKFMNVYGINKNGDILAMPYADIKSAEIENSDNIDIFISFSYNYYVGQNIYINGLSKIISIKIHDKQLLLTLKQYNRNNKIIKIIGHFGNMLLSYPEDTFDHLKYKVGKLPSLSHKYGFRKTNKYQIYDFVYCNYYTSNDNIFVMFNNGICVKYDLIKEDLENFKEETDKNKPSIVLDNEMYFNQHNIRSISSSRYLYRYITNIDTTTKNRLSRYVYIHSDNIYKNLEEIRNNKIIMITSL